MTDPYRIDIIQVLKRSKGVSMTVKEIAVVLGQPHGKVYYHVKKMFDIGALRVDKVEKINGITAKYYALNFSYMEIKSEGDLGSEVEMKLNHSMALINKLYDDSKAEFLASVRQESMKRRVSQEVKDAEDSKDSRDADMMLTTNNLYFTPESYSLFKKELEELFARYEKKQELKDEFERIYFFTMYGSEKDE